MKTDSLNRPAGVIFDVDGTILDSMFIWEEAANRYLESIGQTPQEDLTEKIMTMTLEEGADYIIENCHVDKTREEVIDGVCALVRRFYEEEAPMKPGVGVVIRRLKAAGIPMTVATSSDRDCVEAAFRRLGILDAFDAILTCSEEGVSKKQPEIYLRAAERMQSAPSETWVFEDALHALETAKRAGFVTVGIHDSFNHDEQALRKLADLYARDWNDIAERPEIPS